MCVPVFVRCCSRDLENKHSARVLQAPEQRLWKKYCCAEPGGGKTYFICDPTHADMFALGQTT